MQDFISYAKKHGIELSREGPCQFCGADVNGGVIECHGNAQRLSELLDFNDPAHYQTRFLSVDAMALQHSELHGPWNNHIHLTRLFLIFENNVKWNYSRTPQLSNIINDFKRNNSGTLTPPPLKHRGKTTSSDLLKPVSMEECTALVNQWARDVYHAFKDHHSIVSLIAKMYIDKHYV